MQCIDRLSSNVSNQVFLCVSLFAFTWECCYYTFKCKCRNCLHWLFTHYSVFFLYDDKQVLRLEMGKEWWYKSSLEYGYILVWSIIHMAAPARELEEDIAATMSWILNRRGTVGGVYNKGLVIIWYLNLNPYYNPHLPLVIIKRKEINAWNISSSAQ